MSGSPTACCACAATSAPAWADIFLFEELGRWRKATEVLHEEWIRDVTAKGGDGRKLHAEAAAILGRSAR